MRLIMKGMRMQNKKMWKLAELNRLPQFYLNNAVYIMNLIYYFLRGSHPLSDY